MTGRQLTRDKLEDRLDTMQDAIEDLQTRADLATDARDRLEDELWEVREENEALRERVAELEARADPDPGSKDYHEMDRDERVFQLRVAVVRKARNNGGSALYRYREVASLFDEHPSAGYCYKLMRLAAEFDTDTEESRKAGFAYGDRGGSKALLAKPDAVKDEAVLHAVNNRDTSKGGEN